MTISGIMTRRSENQNIKEDLDNKYGKFCNFLVTETMSFGNMYVYKDPIDPWNLDDRGDRRMQQRFTGQKTDKDP
jgi:hypothetical protein